MATFEQSTFQNSTEALDGNTYKACEFRNCRLVYNGGELPSLVQCNMPGCSWEFGEVASRTILFMSAIYNGGPGGKELIEKTFDRIRLGG